MLVLTLTVPSVVLAAWVVPNWRGASVGWPYVISRSQTTNAGPGWGGQVYRLL